MASAAGAEPTDDQLVTRCGAVGLVPNFATGGCLTTHTMQWDVYWEWRHFEPYNTYPRRLDLASPYRTFDTYESDDPYGSNYDNQQQ